MLPSSWTLAMAGEGALTRELHERAVAMGVASRMRLMGPLPCSEIALWMNAADMLCLPSVTEGCPNVVLEALSCGLPVMATAVGGTPELIDHDSGILIPDNEPAKIAGAIERAIGQTWDRQLIASKHKRGWRQVAMETFEVCQAVVYAGKEAPVL
jgi:teichuronic acid biosynthesis glycosyltransferase TuaC